MNKNELREKYKEESGIDLNKLSGHPVWGYVQWLENVVNDCNKAAVMQRSEQLIAFLTWLEEEPNPEMIAKIVAHYIEGN